MSEVRVRFIGGPLNGQALWIEHHRESLNVQVARAGDTGKQILEYRREGGTLVFVEPAIPTPAVEE